MSTSPRVRRTLGIGATLAYAAMIVAANWITKREGLVPVGFGLMATAGTYFAGAALMLRNVVQDLLGRRTVLLVIAAGAVLSATISPSLALASATAFIFGEIVDMAIYTPLRRRDWWARAVLPANLVGAIIDTFVFLELAGFPLTARGVGGQILGKFWCAWVPVVLAIAVRRLLRARRIAVASA